MACFLVARTESALAGTRRRPHIETTAKKSLARIGDETKMKQPFDAIVWWEIRRIPYNIILLIIGILTLTVVEVLGAHLVKPGDDIIDPPALLVGIVGYGIAANLLYTLGWVTEIAWSGGDTSRTRPLRSRVFLKGVAFSALITIWPAILVLTAEFFFP